MKAVIISFILLMSFGHAYQDIGSLQKVDHEKISFRYMSFDGQDVYSCKHQEMNEWGDWYVYCGDNKEKEFSVRVALRKYTRNKTPKASFEVIYWITNRSNSFEGSGTTVWFHAIEDTNFSEITLNQSTDNDTAGLFLSIKP